MTKPLQQETISLATLLARRNNWLNRRKETSTLVWPSMLVIIHWEMGFNYQKMLLQKWETVRQSKSFHRWCHLSKDLYLDLLVIGMEMRHRWLVESARAFTHLFSYEMDKCSDLHQKYWMKVSFTKATTPHLLKRIWKLTTSVTPMCWLIKTQRRVSS